MTSSKAYQEEVKTVSLGRSILDRLRIVAALENKPQREIGDKILDVGLKKYEAKHAK